MACGALGQSKGAAEGSAARANSGTLVRVADLIAAPTEGFRIVLGSRRAPLIGVQADALSLVGE